MKKLIAVRPIQYMGRTYERGESIPAYDGKMVDAWLAAESAKWTGDEVAEPTPKAAKTPEEQAADTLRDMGISITDDMGAFVGAEKFTEQIFSLTAEPPKGMTRVELVKLAEEKGLKVTKNMTKAEITALIEAEPDKVPDEKNGGAQ